MMKMRVFFVLLAWYSTLFSLISHASSPENKDLLIDMLKERARSSDFVFHGRVTKIDYAKSTTGVAHTFTKFEIIDAVYGDYHDDEIVLRQVGGLYYENGQVMELHVTHMPYFEVGDEAVIFAKDNGKAECPYSGCLQGIYLVADGKLQNPEQFIKHDNPRIPFAKPEPITGYVIQGSAPQPVTLSLIEAREALSGVVYDAARTPEIVSQDSKKPFDGPNLTPTEPKNVDSDVPGHIRDLANQLSKEI